MVGPVNNLAPNSHFHEGKKAFEREDWNEAIRAFHAAIDADRHHADSYIELIRSYEAAADENDDAELFDRAARICSEARKLHLDERRRAIVDEAADRIADRAQELRGMDE